MLYFRPKVYCASNFDIKGKAIIVSNHVSLADPIAIAISVPRPVHFMAKKELFSNGVFAAVLRSLLAFPVNRHNVDMVSLKTALTILDKGKVFGIFPEGKRTVTGEMDELEKGAAFFAVRSNAPIIPIYIDPNSYKKNRVRMIAGKPILVSELSKNVSRSNLLSAVSKHINNSIYSLKADLEAITCR